MFVRPQQLLSVFFFSHQFRCVCPWKLRWEEKAVSRLEREGKGVNKRQKSRKRKSQEILSHKQLSLVECLINQQRQKGTTINKETPSSQQSAINCTALVKDRKRKEKKKTSESYCILQLRSKTSGSGGSNTEFRQHKVHSVSVSFLFLFPPWPCVNNSTQGGRVTKYKYLFVLISK